jgi:hypothetical protein
MKTGEIIVGVLFILSTIGPLMYFYSFGQKRRKKLADALKESADKKSLKLSKIEVWHDKALGYDQEQNVLIYLSKVDNFILEECINLPDMKQISIVNNSNEVSIFINIYGRSPLSLNIFNAMVDPPTEQGFTLQIARRWVNYLNNIIKTNPLKAA